mgnify:FL=1
MNRQSLTYVGLSKLMFGRQASGVLDAILGHIAFYCKEHDLPPLTSIVVNSETGVPGDGIPIQNIPSVREEVYRFDWYDILPPSAEFLKISFENAK